jgi:hypothetical protein
MYYKSEGCLLLICCTMPLLAAASEFTVAPRLPARTSAGACANVEGCVAQPRTASPHANYLPAVCTGPSKVSRAGCLSVPSSNATMFAQIADLGLAAGLKTEVSWSNLVSDPSDGANEYGVPTDFDGQAAEWADLDK